jgi:hypothetical protein
LPSSKIERNILNKNNLIILKFIRHFFLKLYYLRFNSSIKKICKELIKTYSFSKKEFLNYKKNHINNINYLKLPIITKKIKKNRKKNKIKVALTSFHYSMDIIGLRNLKEIIIPELKKKYF